MVGADQIKDVEKRVVTIVGSDGIAVPRCRLGPVEEEDGPVSGPEMGTVR